jgi:hypothetical protein
MVRIIVTTILLLVIFLVIVHYQVQKDYTPQEDISTVKLISEPEEPRQSFSGYWEEAENEIFGIIKEINPTLSADTLNIITSKIIACSQQYYINPYLIVAIIYGESRFIPHVTGSSGDAGLMQIIPSTAKHIASSMGYENYNVTDIETNIEFGCWYLSRLKILSGGNYIETLARYNQGGNWRGGGEKYAQSIINQAEKIGIPLEKMLEEERMNHLSNISDIQ